MPASASCRTASSRFAGVVARGSMLRASLAVERRDRQRDLDQVVPRHAREDVDVAHHQRRLRDDADGMSRRLQHLEHTARDAVLALDRLIGIGDRAERDRLRHVARLDSSFASTSAALVLA